MTNFSPLKIIVSFSIIALSIWFIFFPARFEIISPRLGQPLILQASSIFKIHVKTSTPYYNYKWRASLESRSKSITLELTKTDIDFANQVLNIQLPGNIQDDQYTLVLSDGNLTKKHKNAIYIIKQPSDSINIIQMADLPTLSKEGNKAGDIQLKKIIQETNLINPQIVLFTGDLAYQGSWAQYYQLLNNMTSFNAPLIAAPGNHEYQGWSAFLTLLGQPYHSTIYGNYLIVSLNSGHSRDQLTYSQLKWLKETLEQYKDKTLIVQAHHSIQHRPKDRGYLKNNRTILIDLLKQYSAKIVLAGHWHGDALFDENGKLRNDRWDFSGTPYVVTTAAGAKLRQKNSHSPLHHGYRLIRFKNREIENFTYDYDGDKQRDASSSIPYNQLSISHPDMYTAEIQNKLHETFENILIEFKLPLNSAAITTDDGEIYKRFSTPNNTVVQVNSRLNALSKKSIRLQEQSKK